MIGDSELRMILLNSIDDVAWFTKREDDEKMFGLRFQFSHDGED